MKTMCSVYSRVNGVQWPFRMDGPEQEQTGCDDFTDINIPGMVSTTASYLPRYENVRTPPPYRPTTNVTDFPPEALVQFSSNVPECTSRLVKDCVDETLVETVAITSSSLPRHGVDSDCPREAFDHTASGAALPHTGIDTGRPLGSYVVSAITLGRDSEYSHVAGQLAVFCNPPIITASANADFPRENFDEPNVKMSTSLLGLSASADAGNSPCDARDDIASGTSNTVPEHPTDSPNRAFERTSTIGNQHLLGTHASCRRESFVDAKGPQRNASDGRVTSMVEKYGNCDGTMALVNHEPVGSWFTPPWGVEPFKDDFVSPKCSLNSSQKPSWARMTTWGSFSRRILVAVDASNEAKYAFHWYLEHVWKISDLVILAHVPPTPSFPTFSFKKSASLPVDEWSKIVGNMNETTKRLHEEYEIECLRRNLKYKLIDESFGKTGEGICQLAVDENVDLIVIGKSVSVTLRHVLFKSQSVGDYVVRNAGIPCMIVVQKQI